jgi:hypothetical protein
MKDSEDGETEVAMWAFNYRAWTVYPLGRFKVDLATGRSKSLRISTQK